MKVTELTHGQGETKNLGNYESLRVYNEITVEIEKEDKDVKTVHELARKGVATLRENDINILKKSKRK